MAKLKASKGFLPEAGPVSGFPTEVLRLSQYVDDGVLPKKDILSATPHIRKDGSVESEFDRVARHQSKIVKKEHPRSPGEMIEVGGHNLAIEQKAFKQKIGHLFEIVASPEFLALPEKAAAPRPTLPFTGSPYRPPYKLGEDTPPEAKDLVKSCNMFLFRMNSVNHCKAVEVGYEMTIYLGADITTRLQTMLEEAGISSIASLVAEGVKFGENLVGVDDELSQVSKISINVASEKMEALQKLFEENQKRLFNERGSPPSRPFYLRSGIHRQKLLDRSSALEARGGGGEGRG